MADLHRQILNVPLKTAWNWTFSSLSGSFQENVTCNRLAHHWYWAPLAEVNKPPWDGCFVHYVPKWKGNRLCEPHRREIYAVSYMFSLRFIIVDRKVNSIAPTLYPKVKYSLHGSIQSEMSMFAVFVRQRSQWFQRHLLRHCSVRFQRRDCLSCISVAKAATLF